MEGEERDEAAPSQEAPAPSQESPAPSQDSLAPSQESPAPSQDSLAPSQDSSAPSQGSAASSQGSAAPSQESSAPSQGSAAPSHGSAAPDEEGISIDVHEDTPSDWEKGARHVFILSSAGKPVYSRCGSEEKLVTLFGVMQALVSFVQDCQEDVIQCLHFGSRALCFLVCGPLILVAASSKHESVRVLQKRLTYVYNQVVSVLTLTRLVRIFEQRRNYDLRRLLTGSERLLDRLLDFTESRAEFLLGGVSCLPLPPSARDSVSAAILSAVGKIRNLVFALLVSEDRLITLAHLKKYTLRPSDLHLILNMVGTYESLRTAESWTPICLPDFDASGYLHGHVADVADLSDGSKAVLILLTVDAELFHLLSQARKNISDKLSKSNALASINAALKSPPEPFVAQHLKHFAYKCKRSSNVFVPSKCDPETLRKYECVRDSMEAGGLKLLHQHFPSELVVGWTTDRFELLVSLEPLTTKALASDTIDRLMKWVLKEEDKLFLTTVPTF